MKDELIVLLGGKKAGSLRKEALNRTTFIYDEAWREAPDAYPLSLSMPLTAKEHGPATVEAFLWGLLPDNEALLGQWTAKFGIPARDAFALISHVGEDCAGAVQFILPDRLEAFESGDQDDIEWLAEAAIAERIRALREDHAVWRLPGDTGQFSLAGVQPKTALLFEKGRWGIPHGTIPTTHILKPPTGQFEGYAENEHVCLSLARAIGLPAASSRVMHFEKEIAIVVERYDRQSSRNGIVRIHQEDIYQALGIMPTKKNQNEGGPSIATIVELLRRQSSERETDVKIFINAIAFNWLIAGKDAHAKNYSLLIAGGACVRLAPLYDLTSALPYNEFDFPSPKQSANIGGSYENRQLALQRQRFAAEIHQWRKIAAEIRINADEIFRELRTMSERLPDEVQRVRVMVCEEGLEHGLIDRLAKGLIERAATCRRALETI